MNGLLAWIRERFCLANGLKRHYYWSEWLQLELETNQEIQNGYGQNHPLYPISCLRLGDALEENGHVEAAISAVLGCYRYYQLHKSQKIYLKLSAMRLIRFYAKEEDWDHLIFFYQKLKYENCLDATVFKTIFPDLTLLSPHSHRNALESIYNDALNLLEGEDQIDVYLHIGLFLEAVNKETEAIYYLQKAVKLYERTNRDHSYLLAAYIRLFRLTYRLKRVQEYIYYYRKAVEIAPASADVLRRGELRED